MAIPAAQNSVVGSVATEAIGKAAGANSMMRELGGVFGIAVVGRRVRRRRQLRLAAAFIDGFGPAIGVGAGCSRWPARSPALAPAGRRPTEAGVTLATGGRDNETGHGSLQGQARSGRGERGSCVRAVYEELARAPRPTGLRYATFRLEDGVSFVHLASGRGRAQPAAEVEAFTRFQEDIRDRCDEPPVTSELREVGSYRP